MAKIVEKESKNGKKVKISKKQFKKIIKNNNKKSKKNGKKKIPKND